MKSKKCLKCSKICIFVAQRIMASNKAEQRQNLKYQKRGVNLRGFKYEKRTTSVSIPKSASFVFKVFFYYV